MSRVAQTALLLAGLVLSAVSRANAQAVTGALAGRVLSTAGGPLEGVAVTVSSPALQGERTVPSNDQGRFLFPTVPAGVYSVKFRQVGYRPLQMTDVTVVLGGTTSLAEVQLTPQTVELPEIVVSGAKPLVDPTSVANATVLDSSVFLTLPTERNFRALMVLVPEADPSPYGDGTNIAGSTGHENAYFVDGIHVTDPEAMAGSLNLPYNFVREVQVTTGGYEPEYGRALGGVVNVVTNSGSNEFHGQLLGFFTGNQLRATPRWGAEETPLDRYSQYDMGFSLGGPIRRDRLWFFVAYNPTFETSDASLPGIPTQRDARTSHLFATKLTGRLGPSTDATLTLLGDPSSSDTTCTSISYFPLPANIGDLNAVRGHWRSGGTAVSAQIRHGFNDRLVLWASLSRMDQRTDVTPSAGQTTDMVALARVDNWITNTASGNWGLYYLNDFSRTSGQVSMALLAGAHQVRFGAEFEAAIARGDQRLSYVEQTADTVYNWFKLTQETHARVSTPTVYLEDSWEATRRLSFNLGVRWEAQFISGDTGTAFWIAPEWAPRLGVVFQPGELGAHKLFASFGRFFEQIPLFGPMGWEGFGTQASGAYSHNPLTDTTGGAWQGVSQVGTAPDRNIKGQQYDEWAVGYERRLGRSYRLGLRGTYRTLLWVVDDGAKDPSSPFLVGNPGRGQLSFLPRATRDYTALELTVERAGEGPLSFLASYVLSRTRGNYTGLASTDILLNTSNSGPQFDYPEQTINATGPLPNDRTHVVKFSGIYRLPIGLSVGTSAMLASGEPLNEYGTGPYAPYWTFIRSRGTAGRTPTTWDVDLRFAYDVPAGRGSRLHPRVLLDVFNVGNQRAALMYDQRHYFTPGPSSAPADINPNYMAVTQYQAPLRARMGMEVNF